MRQALAALLLIGCAGCSMSLERYERIIRNCNDTSVDCRLEAIRARVLEAFPSIDVQEVLACATEPTEFCSSPSHDHDACLVSLAKPLTYPGADAAEAAVPYPVPRMLGLANGAFRLLVRDELPSKYGYGPANVSVYVGSDGAHAVLHLAETRCIDINEIT